MEVGRISSKSLAVLSLVCLCLLIFLEISAHGTVLPPWENEDSVRALLAQQYQDGQSVVCEATVDRIMARNNPQFFVLRDEWRASTDPDRKLAVLGRVPLTLGCGQVVRVQGVLGRLPNNEPCILNPVVEGLFDQRGRPLSWTPFPEFMAAANRQVLSAPTGPIPPSDPSLEDDGIGIAGVVSAYATEGVSRFETVASLLATAPSVLSCVEIAAKPIVSVNAEEGYIVVGDDTDGSTVKIYTNNTAVKATDRLIKATAVAHSENGQLVLYAGNGVSPFFDSQGPDAGGGISVAKAGSVAYASTLSDPTSSGIQPAGVRSNSVSVMSVNPGGTSDGNWCYMTGMVVTYIGQYYSYAISPNNWINVYDIQGVDRTPGIRVWSPASYNPSYIGSMVDIMAKVDTKDGQRTLGIWSDDESNAVDLSSSTHCIEPKILATRGESDPELTNVVPVGLINRDLGGGTLGNNPSVTGGQGLYNIGSYVTVWGKVLETGDFDFDGNGSTQPYMVIDDGSGTPDDNQNVTIFGTNSYAPAPLFYSPTPVAVDDYVSVTGVSSIWKPSGSSDTYRCIWTSDYARNQGNPPEQPSREVTATGTISGTVKLYDMPSSTATVQVHSTCGGNKTLTINRGGDNSGSATFSWTDIPKTILVGGYYEEYPEYIVSAKCDDYDYKIRTYTRVTPWTGTAAPRNLYLTRLRKIYVTTSSTSIDSCSGGTNSTVITATVRDSDHNPIQGLTVRFKTNKGSFSSSSVVHSYTPTSTTNSQGQVTATLYGVPSEWGNAIVEATDDSAPLTGDDPDDDPYKYDWEQLHNNYGQPINLNINQPTVNLQLQPDPAIGAVCENQKTLTATLTVCGAAKSGETVTFYTNSGTFYESGTSTRQTTTTTNGTATAT